MVKYEYTFGITGALTARQKIMAMKLLRESKELVLAIDEVNATRANLQQVVANLVIFWPSMQLSDVEGSLIPIEWPVDRILVEGEDFDFGTLPKGENQ